MEDLDQIFGVERESGPAVVVNGNGNGLETLQESFQVFLADHRVAVQRILTESSQRSLEAILASVDRFAEAQKGSKTWQDLHNKGSPVRPATPFWGQESPIAHVDAGVSGAAATPNFTLRPVAIPKEEDQRWREKREQTMNIEKNQKPAEAEKRQMCTPNGENKASAEQAKQKAEQKASAEQAPANDSSKILPESRRSYRKSAPGTRASTAGDDKELKKAVFPDASSMKEQVRQALDKPDYNVADYYKKEGFCRWIATDPWFENFTLIVIAVNAVWIAIDVDNNDTTLLIEADPVFMIADNLFCFFFVFEWAVRFGAFELKRNGLKDAWFVFDTSLAALMAVETWFLTIAILVFGGGTSFSMGDTSLLKGFRLVRLVRMARMLRLLNALPELMVMIKGMFVATRAVSCTILLMVVIVYVFAVLFRQLTDDTELGDNIFPSVHQSMRFLLLYGTLPDLADPTNEIWDESTLFVIIWGIYILVVSITVMNMLIGVLVGVVQTVATVEKEQLMVSFVKRNLLTILADGVKGQDGTIIEADDNEISKDEFDLLITMPEAIRSMEQMGVDVVGLVDLGDYIFKDQSATLPFGDFMELMMQLRGSNQATVKDIVDLRKFIVGEMKELKAELGHIGEMEKTELEKLEDMQDGPMACLQEVSEDTFRQLDVNHDGVISADEFAAGIKEVVDLRFVPGSPSSLKSKKVRRKKKSNMALDPLLEGNPAMGEDQER